MKACPTQYSSDDDFSKHHPFQSSDLSHPHQERLGSKGWGIYVVQLGRLFPKDVCKNSFKSTVPVL